MSHDSSTYQPSPKGASTYMTIKGAAEAIAFYAKAFGASEELRLENPDGKIAHAEIKIGDTVIMLSDEWPDFGALGPIAIGGSPVKFSILVEDADAAFTHAIDAGCSDLRPVEDQFYGYRGGMVTDPYEYSWFIQHKVEELTNDEMQARWSRVQTEM